MKESELGGYVEYAEYAALEAEVERLDKSNTSLLGTIDIIDDKYGELQAEVERLRKAGDAMHLAHEANFNGYPYTQNQVEKAMKAWLAAKGVQP